VEVLEVLVKKQLTCDAATNVLGIEIPSTDPAFLAVVGIHILLGLACTVTGVVAMLSEKSEGRHLRELKTRLSQFTRSQDIIAHCRGPYCVLSYEAVAALRRFGFNFKALRLEDGIPEWRAAGLPLVTGGAWAIERTLAFF
jgi:rhodanese-related sulfurtransferase